MNGPCICAVTQRLVLLLSLSLGYAISAWSAYVPEQNLDPGSASIRLDSSFQSDAWLVYTYEINENGAVVNTTIQGSNGVLEVEQAVLRQVGAMKFRPTMRSGKAVKVSAGPVTYTWILDKPREMSPRFTDLYQRAWGHYAEQNYTDAFEIAGQLRNYPGRNALEEVKSLLLSASLANRRQDKALELRHLSRIVEFQSLAQRNNFNNNYVSSEQYLKILSRIHTLQLDHNRLADAGLTLDTIQLLGRGSDIANEAGNRYRQAEIAYRAVEDVTIDGELVSLYAGGPGAWKAGLSRGDFSVSDVRGRITSVFLVCANAEKQLHYPAKDPWKVPAGWTECEIDVSGEAGTLLVLHQYATER